MKLSRTTRLLKKEELAQKTMQMKKMHLADRQAGNQSKQNED